MAAERSQLSHQFNSFYDNQSRVSNFRAGRCETRSGRSAPRTGSSKQGILARRPAPPTRDPCCMSGCDIEDQALSRVYDRYRKGLAFSQYARHFSAIDLVVGGVNRTYRVREATSTHYLRLYRRSGRPLPQINAEISLQTRFRDDANVIVSRPVATGGGAYVLEAMWGANPAMPAFLRVSRAKYRFHPCRHGAIWWGARVPAFGYGNHY